MSSPSKPRAWLVLAVLFPLALCGTIVILVGMGLVFNASGKSEPVRADERALLLDIEHLAHWVDAPPADPRGERVSKTRYLDDSFELEYVYDLPDGDGSLAPYLSYSITFEGSESDARTTYHSIWGGTEVGFRFGDSSFDIDEREGALRWGDDRRLGVLLSGGRPFGNVYLARKGTRVVYLLVSGVVFDDARALEALVEPYLAKLDARPSGPFPG